jgi:hypothetical protein
VAHLVRAENAEHRRAVRQTLTPERADHPRERRVLEARQDVPRTEIACEGSIMVEAKERRRPDSQQEEQDV